MVAAAVLLAILAYYERNASYMDFRAYYYGAQAVTQGERLYEPGLIWRDTGYTQFFPGKDAPTEHGTYIYPPAAVFAFIPLTGVPYRTAGHIWLAVIFACLLGASYTLSSLLFPGRRWSRIALALAAGAAAFVFHATRVQLGLGQADFVVLLLMTLVLAASARGRQNTAAAWLALAAALKPTVAFLVLWFVWKRAYRAAAIFGVLSGIMFLVPLAVFGPGTIADFLAVAQYFSGPTFAVTPINQSPYGLLLRLFTVNPFTVPILVAPVLADVGRLSIAALVLATLANKVSRNRDLPVAQLAMEYGLLITAMLLVGPLSEDIHYVYLLIPFAAVGAALWRTWKPSGVQVGLAALLVASFAYLSLPGMVDLFFAFDTRVPVPIAAPKLLLTGAMVYGLAVWAVAAVIAVNWFATTSATATSAQNQAEAKAGFSGGRYQKLAST